MKRNIIGLRREDLSKKRETRTPIVPLWAARITAKGGRLIVQPTIHPENGEKKRVFSDAQYADVGAEIEENLSDARVIMGIKEVEIDQILDKKCYYVFSHTHKGQQKNRKMLQAFKDKKCSLIDYELITNERNVRYITAFTYFAGYAGMIDSLWALGERLKVEGITSRFQKVPQSIEKADLEVLKEILREVAKEIKTKGTTPKLPPIVIGFLGNGKTSMGAQEILDELPVVAITPEQLPHIFVYGSRNYVYKLVLSIPDMFRLKAEVAKETKDAYIKMNRREKSDFYLAQPQYFESNMDTYFPYVTMFMNCILWSPKYPRLFSREDTQQWYLKHPLLRIIGDISCDPEGGVEFSRDTWIDNPVFTYFPDTRKEVDGFAPTGIAVMAVTNLPCEFPADSSAAFSKNLDAFFSGIMYADYDAPSVELSELPPAIAKAVILWNGEFTPAYRYMEAFLPEPTPLIVEEKKRKKKEVES